MEHYYKTNYYVVFKLLKESENSTNYPYSDLPKFDFNHKLYMLLS